jgi:uncharacterized RDD family membrane protein YckC
MGDGAAKPGVTADDRPRKLPEAEDFPAKGPNSLAAPGPRFGARALDLALVATPGLVIAALSTTARADQVEIDAPVWTLWVVMVVGIVYETVGVSFWGRTVGKWAFGLRVARYTDGRRPLPAQALLRALVPYSVLALPVPFAAAAALGLWATGASGSLHRGVPDRAGGTIVVATR